MVKYFIKGYERLIKQIFPACSKAAGKRVDQSLTIIDLKDGSMKLMSGKVYDFVKMASKIGQDFYPETLGNMYIVNAPLLFSGVWALIKPWIDEKTRNKIKILGSGYQKELFAMVDPENLPDFLGGKVPEARYGKLMELEEGPWVNEKIENVQPQSMISPEEEKKIVEMMKNLGADEAGFNSTDAEKAFLQEDKKDVKVSTEEKTK